MKKTTTERPEHRCVPASSYIYATPQSLIIKCSIVDNPPVTFQASSFLPLNAASLPFVFACSSYP